MLGALLALFEMSSADAMTQSEADEIRFRNAAVANVPDIVSRPITAWLETSDDEWLFLVPGGLADHLYVISRLTTLTCLVEFPESYLPVLSKYRAYAGSYRVANEFDGGTLAVLRFVLETFRRTSACYARIFTCTEPTAAVFTALPAGGRNSVDLVTTRGVIPATLALAGGTEKIADLSPGLCEALQRGATRVEKAGASRTVFAIGEQAFLLTWSTGCLIALPLCPTEQIDNRLRDAALGSMSTSRSPIADRMITDYGGLPNETTGSIDLAGYAVCEPAAEVRSCTPY